jgi:hypothetical protein
MVIDGEGAMNGGKFPVSYTTNADTGKCRGIPRNSIFPIRRILKQFRQKNGIRQKNISAKFGTV